ncbi:MAG: biopolymer transporter ExbD [Pseudomonadota bacterium]
MQKTGLPSASEDTQDEINLTPMLDVVFIMLIFFIVTASFIRETGLDLSRSDANKEPVPAAENILVSIAEDNAIWIDGRLIDPRAVTANIARLRAERPTSTVIVQAARRSSNKTLVRVIDASRLAGAYDIALAESAD